MRIKGRQGRTPGHQLINTLDTGEQTQQRLLALHDDGGAQLLYQWDITNKEKGVTQTLLGMQQNGQAPCCAAPKRLLKLSRRNARQLPAPLVFLPAALDVTLHQSQQCNI